MTMLTVVLTVLTLTTVLEIRFAVRRGAAKYVGNQKMPAANVTMCATLLEPPLYKMIRVKYVFVIICHTYSLYTIAFLSL